MNSCSYKVNTESVLSPLWPYKYTEKFKNFHTQKQYSNIRKTNSPGVMIYFSSIRHPFLLILLNTPLYSSKNQPEWLYCWRSIWSNHLKSLFYYFSSGNHPYSVDNTLISLEIENEGVIWAILEIKRKAAVVIYDRGEWNYNLRKISWGQLASAQIFFDTHS